MLLPCRYPVFSVWFIAKALFFFECSRLLCPKPTDHVSKGLFWGYHILLLYVTVLMPVSHCFDDCQFVVSFEIRRCEVSIFVLFFKDYFGSLGPLRNHTNFRILGLFLRNKEVIGIFYNDCTKYITLGSTIILIILSLPIYEHEMSFCLFTSLISFSNVF